MDRLPPPYDELTFTRHAQWRMHKRQITLDEVHRALISRRMRGPEWNRLHYDPTTWVGVVVDWQTRTIITVMNVWLTIDLSPKTRTHRERMSGWK